MLNFLSGLTVGSCLLLIWRMLRTDRWEKRAVMRWNLNDITPDPWFGPGIDNSTTFPSNHTNLFARFVMGKERDA